MSFDIAVMQLFNGVSLFSILLLMAIGLAIVFGLMGVINMAHGELMALGAYMTYVAALGFERWAPNWMDVYLFAAIPFAFLVTFVFGYALERGFIRFFYNRPLDTLLATWGLSLIMQQTYRTVFGAQEVSVPLPSWLAGAWEPAVGIQLPITRIFIVGLTIAVAVAVYLLLYRTRWGIKVRAVTQNRAIAGATGINTHRVDALTFALGSGLAGIAGCVFTMIGSTNPGTGQLYIVDSFIVVVFGGVQSLAGDLPPLSRTSVMAAKSVNLENDGHEKKQIHRRADHRLHQAGRGRLADQGVVPQRRFQRRHLLQMARQIRRHGRTRCAAAA